MNIRHVISTNGRLPQDPLGEPASGVVGAALSLARYQAEAGERVDVWGWNDMVRAKETVSAGIRLWTSPVWGWARFARWDVRWLAPVWLHTLTQRAVDILHVHVDPNLLYLPRANIRLLHLHTPVPDPFPPSYRQLLRHAQAVICCSHFIRQQFLPASGYPPERTYVVHNGADQRAYASADGCAQRVRWGFTERDFVILYSGAIFPQKGVAHLVNAFAQIQATLPNATLVIAGSARLWATPGGYPMADDYEAYVQNLAHGLKVRFLGRLPRAQMPAVYLAADVVVVPSVWEDPHPTVVCEAMAAGRPVVASQTGGITETVVHGKTGLLVSPGDEKQLSEAILMLATRESVRRKMGEAAHKHAEEFTWEASASILNTIYRNLLEKQRNSGNENN